MKLTFSAFLAFTIASTSASGNAPVLKKTDPAKGMLRNPAAASADATAPSMDMVISNNNKRMLGDMQQDAVSANKRMLQKYRSHGVLLEDWTHPNGGTNYFKFDIVDWEDYFGPFTTGSTYSVKLCREGAQLDSGLIIAWNDTTVGYVGRWDDEKNLYGSFFQDDVFVKSDESCNPWEIVLPDTNPEAGDVVVDFSETSGPGSDTSGDLGTITTKYIAWAVGAPNAILESFLVDGVCAASSSGQATPINSTGTCTDTGTSTSTECTYDFDKSNMAANYNYDPTAATLKVCEVAQLKLPVTDGDDLIVEQYFTNVELQFNTTAGFSVTGINMTKATISENTQETTLSDYLEAYKCDAAGNRNTAEATKSLSPNELLHVCVNSKSTDVLIDSVEEMKIEGTDSNGGPSKLDVIKSSHVPVYPSITSISAQDKKTVQIDTRVATNIFDFERDGASIDITGKVILMFTNSTDAGRKLAIDMSDRVLQENGEDSAEFGVVINLESGPELDLEEEGTAMMNSAKARAGKAFAILGMAFASAFALW